MALLPKVKLKAIVSFPATINDGTGIDVVKQNGTYQFDLAFDDFAPPVAGITDPAHQNALLWNDVTHQYVLAPVSIIGAGGAVPEAPNDGVQYGRQSLTWTPVVSGGTPSSSLPLMDGTAAAGAATTYSRGDHVHPTDTSRAPLASPVFTGDPKAPTPSPGDNDTSIATTAYVTAAIAAGGPGGTPSDSNPLMDGTAAPGVSALYSRGDHVHPSDTAKQAADADLTAVAALSGTGIARRTSSAPTWSVGTAVVNSELATMAAFTFKGNNTGGAAAPTDVDIAALTTKGSPAGTDYLLISDQSASGAWKKVAISTMPGASGGITDAPNDGQTYGRKSLGWVALAGGGGTPSDVLPGMDGAASAGVSALYSRGDHVHPSDTTKAATTYVDSQDALKAPIASPTFTGVPAAPTATAGTNTTQVATTAFVTAAVPVAATAAEYLANSAPTKMLTPGAVWGAVSTIVGLPSSTPITPDFATGVDFVVSLTATGYTLANPTNAKVGQKGLIYILQDATGSRTITTYGSAWRFAGGAKPVLTSSPNGIDIISYAVYGTANLFATFNSGFA